MRAGSIKAIVGALSSATNCALFTSTMPSSTAVSYEEISSCIKCGRQHSIERLQAWLTCSNKCWLCQESHANQCPGMKEFPEIFTEEWYVGHTMPSPEELQKATEAKASIAQDEQRAKRQKVHPGSGSIDPHRQRGHGRGITPQGKGRAGRNLQSFGGDYPLPLPNPDAHTGQARGYNHGGVGRSDLSEYSSLDHDDPYYDVSHRDSPYYDSPRGQGRGYSISHGEFHGQYQGGRGSRNQNDNLYSDVIYGNEGYRHGASRSSSYGHTPGPQEHHNASTDELTRPEPNLEPEYQQTAPVAGIKRPLSPELSAAQKNKDEASKQARKKSARDIASALRGKVKNGAYREKHNMKPTVDTKMEEIPDTDIRSLQEAIPFTKANNAREQHTVNLEHQVEELKRKNEANAALVEAMTVAERRMVTELETTRSQLRIANQTIAQVQAAVGMYTVPKISDM
jgi:hypothetical protein